MMEKPLVRTPSHFQRLGTKSARRMKCQGRSTTKEKLIIKRKKKTNNSLIVINLKVKPEGFDREEFHTQLPTDILDFFNDKLNIN